MAFDILEMPSMFLIFDILDISRPVLSAHLDFLAVRALKLRNSIQQNGEESSFSYCFINSPKEIGTHRAAGW